MQLLYKLFKRGTMKRNNFLLCGCLFAGLLITSCSKDDDELNDTDRNFMTGVSISNTAEVDAATLAVSKASTPQVMAFAQHMLAEHGLAQTDLKSLGASVGHTVNDTIDPTHVAIKTQLMALSGREFDSAYMHTQVTDHQNTLSMFQTEQNDGQHEDVTDYADRYRPHIEMHLQRADSIATNLFRR
jgi:putative membrane protein